MCKTMKAVVYFLVIKVGDSLAQQITTKTNLKCCKKLRPGLLNFMSTTACQNSKTYFVFLLCNIRPVMRIIYNPWSCFQKSLLYRCPTEYGIRQSESMRIITER